MEKYRSSKAARKDLETPCLKGDDSQVLFAGGHNSLTPDGVKLNECIKVSHIANPWYHHTPYSLSESTR